MANRSTTWARGVVLVAAGVVVAAGVLPSEGADPGDAAASPTVPAASPFIAPTVLSDPAGFGMPWGSAVQGVLTFRGNPTRSYHGTGPVPVDPAIRWSYPASERMCSDSTEFGETRTWCGTGWTGQPAVFERDGRTWVVFGAYDARVHFVDGETGEAILPPLQTGDLAKGAITVDPDGYPLVYTGSRDNELRVIAIDRPEPTVLWSLDARDAGEGRWNDDWDAAPLVVEDHLVEGGENGRLHVIGLNRGYQADGLVTVDPRLTWSAPGWDDELLRALGDHRVSMESSVMVLGDVAYVANSGGLVQGWDLSSLRTGIGEPTRVFRFWTGDDTDATIVGDDAGYLYVGVEVDRDLPRGDEVGQFVKLDPRRPEDAVVWSVDVDAGPGSGTWSTPAVVGDTVVWPTKPGVVHGLSRTTGDTRWTIRLPGPLLGSPTVVDGVLLLGDSAGVLHAFDLDPDGGPPTERWQITLGGTIESTAAVWKGAVYLGTRGGHVYAVGDLR
jgi:outer membrane protein assembly factor BamB